MNLVAYATGQPEAKQPPVFLRFFWTLSMRWGGAFGRKALMSASHSKYLHAPLSSIASCPACPHFDLSASPGSVWFSWGKFRPAADDTKAIFFG